MGLGKLRKALKKIDTHVRKTHSALDDARRGDIKGAAKNLKAAHTAAADLGQSVFKQGLRDLKHLKQTQPAFERSAIKKAIDMAHTVKTSAGDQQALEALAKEFAKSKGVPKGLDPFFRRFLENAKKQPLPIDDGRVSTMKYPSDNEDAGSDFKIALPKLDVQTMKAPSDAEDNGGGGGGFDVA